MKDFNYLNWDKGTLAIRAGFPCKYVVYHESGMCYAVTSSTKKGAGAKLPEGRARAFKTVFEALKPSEPDMVALAVDSSKPAKETALSFWPGAYAAPATKEEQATEEQAALSTGGGRFSSKGASSPKDERPCSNCGNPIRMIRLHSTGKYIPVDATMYLGGNDSPPLITMDGLKHQNPGPDIRGYIPHFCNRKEPGS